jgi:hypothetical protein
MKEDKEYDGINKAVEEEYNKQVAENNMIWHFNRKYESAVYRYFNKRDARILAEILINGK